MKLFSSKNIVLLVYLGALTLLGGCASTQPVGGMIYSDVKGPVSATSNTRAGSFGEACATSYLGLFAMGDASIATAAKNGGVLVISNVDQHSTNILGLIHTYCTQVWGSKNAPRPAMQAAAPGQAAPAPVQRQQQAPPPPPPAPAAGELSL